MKNLNNNKLKKMKMMQQLKYKIVTKRRSKNRLKKFRNKKWKNKKNKKSRIESINSNKMMLLKKYKIVIEQNRKNKRIKNWLKDV